ncbi:MAG: lipopolysaccharide transport system permease protein [Pseudohongiellaceae bacterium]
MTAVILAVDSLRKNWLRHKELVLGLTRRELFSQFAGSGFGVGWALLHPLLQMFVYLLVFTFIFRVRWPDAGGGMDSYQAYILSGMVSWMLWASLLPGACTTVLYSASLVKQADFPAHVLPVRTLLVNLVPHGVSLAVLGLYILVSHGGLPWTVILLPLVVLLQATAMLGMTFILSALCVFARDVKELITVFTSLGIFLTPVFYTPDMLATLPPVVRWLMGLNPFTHFLYIYRDVLFWGEIRHPMSWWICAIVAPLLLVGGYRAFARLRLFFGNFL